MNVGGGGGRSYCGGLRCLSLILARADNTASPRRIFDESVIGEPDDGQHGNDTGERESFNPGCFFFFFALFLVGVVRTSAFVGALR